MNEIINDFLRFHDKWISEWMLTKGKADTYKVKENFKSGVNGELNFDDMPSPYLGDPYNCSAVIININPGASSEENETIREEEKKLSMEIGGKYREFASIFHFLNPSFQETNAIDKKGNKWWSKRMEWMKRMEEIKDSEPIKYPFALELCPWHSYRWGGFKKDENGQKLKENIRKWVLNPAVEAVKENKLKCVYAIGKPIYECLAACCCNEGKHYIGSEWKDVDDSLIWPQNRKGGPVNREFCVLTYDGVKILCTWAQGGNKTPGKGFDDIIQAIISR